ncbi:MAG: hypothetical protein B7Y25_01400 [Alphaproteobacteria bacterium 16-39-46]|nr:MAG: hypothetical protein B7Y25_01400 [Alphaproteobacteria bacterium 16-39-46]OZA44071.1 MAG: hypothetical protein B7X84_01385 [Alphaproteobacteria bacterium 17-39-52]HQS83587.1 hypothetical protein [Alphaproteobacteria bacterium]HQS93376.1 hypothetical protein [Alphaproteobacteria bacterium]
MFQHIQNNLKIRFINLFKGKTISFVILLIFFNLLSANIFVSHANPEEEAFRNLESLRSSYRQTLWEYQDSGPEIKMTPLKESLRVKSEEILGFILLGRHEQFSCFDFRSVDSEDHLLLITEAFLEAVLYPSANMVSSVKYLQATLQGIKESRDPNDPTYADRYLYIFKNLVQAAFAITDMKGARGESLTIIMEGEDLEKEREYEGENEQTADMKFLEKIVLNPKSLDPLLISGFEAVRKTLGADDISRFEMAYRDIKPFALVIGNDNFFPFNVFSMHLKLGEVVQTFPIPPQQNLRAYFLPRKDLYNAMGNVSLSLGDNIIYSGDALKRTFTGNNFELIVRVPFSTKEKGALLDYGFTPRVSFPAYHRDGSIYRSPIQWNSLWNPSSVCLFLESTDIPSTALFRDNSISLHLLKKGSIYSSENPDPSSLEKRFAQTRFPYLERIDFDALSTQELIPVILNHIAQGVKHGHYPNLYQIKSRAIQDLSQYPELSSIALCSSQQLDPHQYSLNFLWIKRGTSQFGQYIFPACDQKTLVDQYLRTILQWGYINTRGAIINIWYDLNYTTEASISQTRAVLTELTEKEPGSFPPILLRNIREIPLIKENLDVFSPQLPLYFRIDLSKQIILYHMIKVERGSYAAFCDIDMDAVSKEDLFDRKTLGFLQRYGIVMAQVDHRYFENGFQMISNHNENLLEAMKHALIDLNLERGREALTIGESFYRKGARGAPFKPLQQIVYDSITSMFKFFYSLEGVAEFTASDGTPYDKSKHGFSVFGVRSLLSNFTFKIIGNGLEELRCSSCEIPIPRKIVCLPPAGLYYDD